MNIAVILAGGIGSRVGSQKPKQFIEVLGKPVLAYTIEIFQNHFEIDAIEIVCVENYIDYFQAALSDPRSGEFSRRATEAMEIVRNISFLKWNLQPGIPISPGQRKAAGRSNPHNRSIFPFLRQPLPLSAWQFFRFLPVIDYHISTNSLTFCTITFHE